MVTMKVKAPHREACRQALRGDARGSAYDEPGCLRFDVLQEAMETNTFYLYEV
jgi:(4S)-4-hydroxy-5-phosphonooxypentane-2,3-dione isomerase